MTNWKQYKITTGLKAKITVTEYSITSERTSKLQGRILELVGTLRNENRELMAYLWKDDKGEYWETNEFTENGGPMLTNVHVRPVIKGDHFTIWVPDYKRSLKPIKILKFEKII